MLYSAQISASADIYINVTERSKIRPGQHADCVPDCVTDLLKNLPERHDDKRFVLLFIGDNYILHVFLLNESILLTNTFAKIDYEDYRDFLSVPFFNTVF